MSKVTIELNDGSSVEVIKRCAHCVSMSCKRSNGYRFLCSKYGPKKLNDVCGEFVISDVLVEALKTSKKHNLADIIKLFEKEGGRAG